MKVFTAIVLLCGILVFLEIPETILARSPPRFPVPLPNRPHTHEVYSACLATDCQLNCGDYGLTQRPCTRACRPGYICEEGYRREYSNGPCIPEVDCHPLSK